MNRQKNAAAYRAAQEKQTASRRRKAVFAFAGVTVLLGLLGGGILFASFVISASLLQDPQDIYRIAVICAVCAALYFTVCYFVLEQIQHCRVFSPAAGKKTAPFLTFLALFLALGMVLLTQIL